LGYYLIWHATVWRIWRSRNNIIFSHGVIDLEKVVDEIKLLSWRWGLSRHKIPVCLFYEWCWDPGLCLHWCFRCFLGVWVAVVFLLLFSVLFPCSVFWFSGVLVVVECYLLSFLLVCVWSCVLVLSFCFCCYFWAWPKYLLYLLFIYNNSFALSKKKWEKNRIQWHRKKKKNQPTKSIS
jgi:hypothetical protein